MATVKELLTNLGDSTRKFLGTSDTLSLEEMAVGIGKASDESDFQTELIEEFSNILDRSAAPDSYANGKEDGYADALDKRTDLVATENGEYTPPDGSTGFKSVTVEVASGGSTGGNDVTALLFAIVDRSVTAVTMNISSIGKSAFSNCTNLQTASFPETDTVGQSAFEYCNLLARLSIPNLSSAGTSAFRNCPKLESVNFPKLKSVDSWLFGYDSKLLSVDLLRVSSIGASAFSYCYSLTAVILRFSGVCTLSATNSFTNCYHLLGTVNATYNPNGAKDCYIYVPREFVESYKSATNWSAYSTQFRALEDYTVDGTITGALDPTKI
jgi:hypothetical protein